MSRGEYTVSHLRPVKEHLDKFMPLWEARNAATERGDKQAEMTLTSKMRQYQTEVGETETFPNLLTNVGKNDLLDKLFKDSFANLFSVLHVPDRVKDQLERSLARTDSVVGEFVTTT